jgi:beta-lactamase superfamily II metal-dependent hydrolase
MEIKIFDVSHGFCSLVTADNGNRILFDCGHNNITGFRPSSYFRNERIPLINRFFITNFDEDHISDLPNISTPIEIFHVNKSISCSELFNLKQQSGGTVSPGMQALLNMMNSCGPDVYGFSEFSDVEIESYNNYYPNFDDTNNLSLVTFIHYDGINIIFPGDLEKKGWDSLLSNQSFRDHLSRVNIFIASHHGRENGYNEEIFEYCSPEIIIISDESIKYDTQDVDYKKHSKGIPWDDRNTRYVLTTRNDGMITITDPPGYSFFVRISK